MRAATALLIAFAVGGCEVVAGIHDWPVVPDAGDGMDTPGAGGVPGSGDVPGSGGASGEDAVSLDVPMGSGGAPQDARPPGDGGPSTCLDEDTSNLSCDAAGVCTLYKGGIYEVSGVAVFGDTVVWPDLGTPDGGEYGPLVVIRGLGATTETKVNLVVDVPRDVAFDGNGEIFWNSQTVSCVGHAPLANLRDPAMGLSAVSKCGGCSKMTPDSGSGPGAIGRVVVSGSLVYTILSGDAGLTGTVVAYDTSGATCSGPTPIASDEPSPGGIAVDGQVVYWATYAGDTPIGGPGASTINRLDRSATPAVLDAAFASGTGRIDDLIVRDGYLYWTTRAGPVHRRLLTAGAAIETIGALNNPYYDRSRMAIDDNFVYWHAQGVLYFARKEANAVARMLYTLNTGAMFGLTAGCAGIYWTDQNGYVRRMSKPID